MENPKEIDIEITRYIAKSMIDRNDFVFRFKFLAYFLSFLLWLGCMGYSICKYYDFIEPLPMNMEWTLSIFIITYIVLTPLFFNYQSPDIIKTKYYVKHK